MGAVPHKAANEAEDRSRSGLSPAVISSWAPMTGPTPLMASRAGLALVVLVSIRVSRSAIVGVWPHVSCGVWPDVSEIGRAHV